MLFRSQVVLGVFAEDRSLDEAMARARLFRAGPATALLYESALEGEDLNGLRGEYSPLIEADRLGAVNAVVCLGGVRSEPESCKRAVDPRWFGLATGDAT